MRSHRIIPLLLVLVSACDGPRSPTAVAGPASQSAVAGDSISNEGPDIVAVSRFAVRVQAAGSFRPGQPIQIVAAVRANLDTDDAEFSLRLPEVAAARQSRWDAVDLPLGVPVPAAAAWRRRMTRGQEMRHTTTVTIPEPGYYMVVATAAAESGGFAENGSWVQEVAHQELWLWISEDGGRVTETFDPGVFPAGARRQPGPLSFERGPAKVVPRQGGRTAQTASVAGAMTLVATYWNPTTFAVDPLPNATVEYTVYSAIGEQLYTKLALTDAYGRASIPCEYDEFARFGSYAGAVYTSNGDIRVEPAQVGTFSGGFAADCGAMREARVAWKSAHVFAIMNRTVTLSRTHFGYARGHLMVYLQQDATNSFYTASRDYVVIKDGTESHVGGATGDFIVAHEYGHAMHEKALGGNTGGSCPSPHHISGAYNLACAFSEGFADYHGAVAMDNQIRYNFERNKYYPGTHGSGDRNDGSIIEGAVAAFLYDLTDEANEAHDLVHHSGRYVAEIIRTCENQPHWMISGWVRANGVDHLVACFERTLPNYSAFFASRDPDPVAFREYALEPPDWSNGYIRRAWKKNLYNIDDSGGGGGGGGGIEPPPPDDCTVDPSLPC